MNINKYIIELEKKLKTTLTVKDLENPKIVKQIEEIKYKNELKKYAKIYENELNDFILENITEDELTEIMKKEGVRNHSFVIYEILDNHLLVDEEDRCFECHNIIKDGDLTTEQNPCPYGDTVVCETLVEGYVCSNCGYSEKY